jgi:hypothetical protein
MEENIAVTRELWLKCLYQSRGNSEAPWVTKVFKTQILAKEVETGI